MIIIAGTVTVKPEARDQAIAAAQTMMTATQTEPGCIRYDFSAHIADPNTFLIFEIWQNEAALQAHFQTSHMAEFSQKTPAFLTSSDIKRYEISAVSDL